MNIIAREICLAYDADNVYKIKAERHRRLFQARSWDVFLSALCKIFILGGKESVFWPPKICLRNTCHVLITLYLEHY